MRLTYLTSDGPSPHTEPAHRARHDACIWTSHDLSLDLLQIHLERTEFSAFGLRARPSSIDELLGEQSPCGINADVV